MKKRATYLYRFLQEDLQHCREKGFEPIKEFDCCFHVADHYWSRLRKEVTSCLFPSTAEEIDFFKTVKPLFTLEIEYYSLVFYSELCHAKITDPTEIKQFWSNETLRLKKFIKKNENFYTYYKTGCIYKDEEYFTRAKRGLNDFLIPAAVNHDERTTTSHDPLVAKILALEKYMNYTKSRLKESLN